jgi:hypothetical protein
MSSLFRGSDGNTGNGEKLKKYFQPSTTLVPAYEQQTFLNTTIKDFTCTAGFGDSPSTLSVNLTPDEYFEHEDPVTGEVLVGDNFDPPSPGAPLFFLFGDKQSDIPTSYINVFNNIYGNEVAGGNNHFCFGGILQAINESRDIGGNPSISCQLTDPREVLSNVSLILNSYAGSTFNNDNLLNIYGFLEFNTPDDFLPFGLFTKSLFPGGSDMFGELALNVQQSLEFGGGVKGFPITGTGFSRRCPQGIPFFRVVQAINALTGFFGDIPALYDEAGFGGFIKFRGYNYMVDLSGLPALDDLYFIDYDQMTLLDLCLEVCEVSNTELFVTLLPITNHPASNFLEQRFANQTGDGALHGIIRVDGIDRSQAQSANALQDYLDALPTGTNITSKSLGKELTTVTTDKFVVGANEVEMYYFHGYSDRNPAWAKRYTLEESLSYQILPYFGTLPRKVGADSKNSKIVALPKGIGAYQQIMLDATSLNAIGVGNFYVTTELELRSALAGFKRWSEFLIDYDNVYMESTEANDVEEGAALQATPPIGLAVQHHPRISNNYAVTVPRSVWPNDGSNVGCNPNYGYPLYYGRATAIGLPSSSALSIGNAAVQAVEQEAETMGMIIEDIKDGTLEDQLGTDLSTIEKERLIKGLKRVNQNKRGRLANVIRVSQTLEKQGFENAKKVFDFVKGVAEECLGKKFLVKVPQKVNLYYDKTITRDNRGNIANGPFGFPPRNITTGGYQRPDVQDAILGDAGDYVGALEHNFNPLTKQFEFNYTPSTQGGYYESDLLNNNGGDGDQALHIFQGLAPADFTLFDLGNNRTSAYVRFDHSQHLLFKSFSPDTISLQVNQAGFSVPDLSYSLDNLSDGQEALAPGSNLAAQVAFVKATVDEEFYMAPQTSQQKLKVYGQHVNFNWTISPEKKIFNPDTCEYENAIGYSYAQPIPLQRAGAACDVVHYDATTENGITVFFPDTNHIYCLITLPNRAEPSIDSRLRDGPLQAGNTLLIKHFLGADVVRGLCGFNRPALRGTPTNLTREYATPPLGEGLIQAINKVRENQGFTEVSKQFVPGSPVYPDVVAIPFLSRDRTYGPWATQNGGGKIEFSQDENLAPWNFNGYAGMNAAGNIKAGLTTGALLTSGRGAFQVAGVPFGGVFLGRAISANGPLVSNITVNVGANGINTEYQLSLYTMKFGKLQKQREGNIARITRQQQRIQDERNAQLRKGFGKGQSGNVNITALYNSLGGALRSINSAGGGDQSSRNAPRHEIITIMPQLENYRPGGFQAGPDNFGNSSNIVNSTNVEVKGSILSDEQLNDAAQEFQGNFGLMNQAGYNTASNTVGQGRVPTSLEPGHPNMTSQEMPSQRASRDLYFKEDGIPSSKIATWGQSQNKGGNDGAV